MSSVDRLLVFILVIQLLSRFLSSSSSSSQWQQWHCSVFDVIIVILWSLYFLLLLPSWSLSLDLCGGIITKKKTTTLKKKKTTTIVVCRRVFRLRFGYYNCFQMLPPLCRYCCYVFIPLVWLLVVVCCCCTGRVQ
jgi:hypothetical protein